MFAICNYPRTGQPAWSWRTAKSRHLRIKNAITCSRKWLLVSYDWENDEMLRPLQWVSLIGSVAVVVSVVSVVRSIFPHRSHAHKVVSFTCSLLPVIFTVMEQKCFTRKMNEAVTFWFCDCRETMNIAGQWSSKRAGIAISESTGWNLWVQFSMHPHSWSRILLRHCFSEKSVILLMWGLFLHVWWICTSFPRIGSCGRSGRRVLSNRKSITEYAIYWCSVHTDERRYTNTFARIPVHIYVKTCLLISFFWLLWPRWTSSCSHAAEENRRNGKRRRAPPTAPTSPPPPTPPTPPPPTRKPRSREVPPVGDSHGQSTVAPLPSQLSLLKPIPILVIACNRVAVSQCLDKLIQHRWSAEQFPIIVSQVRDIIRTREICARRDWIVLY